MSELPIVLLLLLAVAFLLRMDIVFYLVYVLAGTYALARWWTGRNLDRMAIRRRFTDHIFTGETISVEVQLHNRSWWPIPWLRYEEAPPITLSTGSAIHQVVALRPKEDVRLSYDLAGHQRGYYQIGPGILNTGDLFGFTESRGMADEPQHLTVYPRVIPLTHVELTSRAPHGTIKSRQHIFADPARISGIREYRSGDPLKAIDWKSSARVGSLQVKKYEPAVSLTTVIFLDLNAAAYTRQLRTSASEWAIVVASSLANYLIGQRQAVGLACNGVDPLTESHGWTIPPRPGRTHLMKLLEWLARVQLDETVPLAERLPAAAVGLAWGTTVVAVTPSGDQATCTALHRLRRTGLNPVLMAIEPHGQFAIVQERSHRLGVLAYLAASEDDLKRWQVGPVARVA